MTGSSQPAAATAEIGRSISSRIRRGTSPIVGLCRPAALLLLAILAVGGMSSPAAAQAADTAASAGDPASQTPAKIPSEMCLSCHGTAGFAVQGPDGKPRSLFVDQDKFKPSIHGGRQCVDCHTNITSIPHLPIAGPGQLRQLPRKLVGQSPEGRKNRRIRHIGLRRGANRQVHEFEFMRGRRRPISRKPMRPAIIVMTPTTSIPRGLPSGRSGG